MDAKERDRLVAAKVLETYRRVADTLEALPGDWNDQHSFGLLDWELPENDPFRKQVLTPWAQQRGIETDPLLRAIKSYCKRFKIKGAD